MGWDGVPTSMMLPLSQASGATDMMSAIFDATSEGRRLWQKPHATGKPGRRSNPAGSYVPSYVLHYKLQYFAAALLLVTPSAFDALPHLNPGPSKDSRHSKD